MDVKELYKSKLMSSEDAAKLIKDGDHVYVGSLAGTPGDFMFALMDRYEELNDVYLAACCMMYDLDFFTDPEVAKHMRYETFFLMPPWERVYYKDGLMDVASIAFSHLPYHLLNVAKVTKMAIAASPMDEEGYFWFGPNGTAVVGFLSEHMEQVIIQVCEDQPKPFSTKPEWEKIHVSRVDAIIEEDMPYLSIPAVEVSDTDRKIAEYIIPEVEDGCTIQLGIGGLANAIGYGLEGKKDLSVFTEMVTESMMHLVKKGVITGPITGGFTLGSEELGNFSSQNEQLKLVPINEVCNANNIGKIDNLVSVNTCLMVDLFGQVASEAIGNRLIACTGGSTDFTRGANISKGGKSYMCLPSTREVGGETISNIVFSFPPATPVTILRTEVQNIVTEYGIANVYNKNIRERIEAMISIAHPDFREELTRQAKEAKITF